MKSNTYCIDNRCSYWRNTEHIYSAFVSKNEELGKHLFSFKNFIALE
ncbi:MAG TPA: hypothetical protein PLH80_01605 [Spirochaetota bacterium]|nr:hypothetical protein [Spirochaetota bacterium]MBP8179234.1 hypothetical protein [Spirochaetota bacterium]HOE20123.1 hypothetical protein [Spirochaetota bacterium]HOM88872.1 hypothetical protein [Spirochaetota bacterium]HOR94164.1 hypothetical protein [Spirochaetota bacterium]